MHLLIRLPVSSWRGLALIAVSLIAIPLPAQTLQELQSQLEIAKTQLALADAQLELLKRQQQLAELRTGDRPAETPPPATPTAVTPPAQRPALPALAEAKPQQRRDPSPKTKVTTTVPDGTGRADAQPPAGTATDEARNELRRAGIVKLNKLLPLQRDTLLGANGVPPDTFAALIKAPAGKPEEIDDLLADKRARTRAARESNRSGENDEAEIARLAADETTQAGKDIALLDTLLVSLGFEIEEIRARNAGTATDPDLTAAAKEFGRNAVIEIPAKSPEDVALRNAGISFSQGFGIAFGSEGRGGDASVGTFIARWNLIQRSAAGKWNRWVGENNAEGDAQIPYRGKIEYWLGRMRYSENRPPARRERTWPELTAFGPFLGTAIAGDKVKFGADEERPWLVGLSTGLGFYKDAASLLYLDVGATVSPKSGFEHSHLFAGLSLDAIVLGRILGLTRNAHLPTENGK